MLKSFFWSEYGYEIDNLNLHVLFDYLEIDMSCPCFKLIPNVDEAYTVPGGMGQITASLEKICHDHVLYNRRVNSIGELAGVIHVSSTNADLQIETHTAQHVLYAAPLYSLKNIKIMIEGLAPEAVELASAASYANGAKLHLKFETGFDKLYRCVLGRWVFGLLSGNAWSKRVATLGTGFRLIDYARRLRLFACSAGLAKVESCLERLGPCTTRRTQVSTVPEFAYYNSPIA